MPERGDDRAAIRRAPEAALRIGDRAGQTHDPDIWRIAQRSPDPEPALGEIGKRTAPGAGTLVSSFPTQGQPQLVLIAELVDEAEFLCLTRTDHPARKQLLNRLWFQLPRVHEGSLERALQSAQQCGLLLACGIAHFIEYERLGCTFVGAGGLHVDLHTEARQKPLEIHGLRRETERSKRAPRHEHDPVGARGQIQLAVASTFSEVADDAFSGAADPLQELTNALASRPASPD